MNQDNNQSLNEKINKLVLCIQDGDKDAFSELYDILINPLYRYLYFSIDRSNIDDVAMTIFIKVWEKISKYNVKKDASFKAWFFRLAKNTVIDFYRSNKITYELPEYMPDTSNHNNPEFQIKETLKQEKLKFCISKLNENYRFMKIITREKYFRL